MSIFEQVTLVILLTIDCAFVSAFLNVSKSPYKREKTVRFLVELYFSLINFFVSILGFYLGKKILPWIMDWDHWVVFIVFSYLSWKQWKWHPTDSPNHINVNKKTILILGVLSTIDVFTVSLTLTDFLYSPSIYFISIILVTFIFMYLGPHLITLAKKKSTLMASRIASLILFFIGFKILIEHLTQRAPL